MTKTAPGSRRASVRRIGFRTQMILFVGTLVVLMLAIQGAYLNQRYAQVIEHQIGQRALAVAKTVAEIPELVAAFDIAEPATVIQPIAEAVRVQTGATFVVVGNRESIRYSHPLPDRLGQRMVGEDNEPALERGEAYVSRATGSLGPSIRGKVPVFDGEGGIVGVVSVGFLADEIEQRVAEALVPNRVLMVLVALLGLGGAVWIASRFKRVILGLEPHEIARRLEEKDAILESIHEGIVAVNAEGDITLLNHAARRFLPDDALALDPVGRPVRDVLPKSRLTEVLENGEAQFDSETWIGDQLVVVNRVPINVDGQIEGAVATFRSRMEILELSRSLIEVRRFADELRAQAHEFSNKLHTIAGLLQLDRPREALELIGQETQVQQRQIAVLKARVADPVLCGMLAGKIIRAGARGIDVDVERDSSMKVRLSGQGREAMLTIVGNLIENACEAQRADGVAPRVRVFFTDMGDDLVFEIDDNGQGVPESLAEAAFESGVSTKGPYRGIGLALVRELCQRHGGEVALEQSELGGACFIAIVGKRHVCAEERHD
ncbi:ATP-binding protein [Azoarcus taiwanensis]|uniref:histidine kinase n=1 Tax=Azoarcus taiwanensis TaxID=666964 RepID=A0A972FEM3_9RHOO|nr:sensor histidine kinase [Azoarcus taiwanensis]NMG04128.1 PAS domain-containing protein [Azoarcus taiwanensis]